MSFFLIPFKSGHALSPVVLKAYTALTGANDALASRDFVGQ